MSAAASSPRCIPVTRGGAAVLRGWRSPGGATGNDPLQAIQKLDLQSGSRCLWSAAPRGFVSEPVMVPRPGATVEDDGWVLCVVWSGARRATDLVILDAADLRQEAVLHLPLAVPYGPARQLE